MVSKVQERIYAETAAKILDVNWSFVDIEEPLDFEVRAADERFGLEVRQVFVDPESSSGSALRQAEGINQRHIRDIASRYYEQGGRPLLAKFLGSLEGAKIPSLVKCMLREAPHFPFESNTVSAHGVKVFLTAIPAEFGNYRRWVYLDDCVGWVNEISNEVLQHAVDRKKDNLPKYLEKYSIIDLLLVADGTVNSGRMISVDSLSVQNPGFRAIYFLSYPLTVTQINTQGNHPNP